MKKFRKKSLAYFIILTLLAFGSFSSTTFTAYGAMDGTSAGGITPTEISGNDPNMSGYQTLKIDPPNSGTYQDGELTVTASVYDGKFVDWYSNIPVAYVFVKGGNGGFLYDYGSGSTGDEELRAPDNNGGNQADISHVTFYYLEPVDEPEEPVDEPEEPVDEPEEPVDEPEEPVDEPEEPVDEPEEPVDEPEEPVDEPEEPVDEPEEPVDEPEEPVDEPEEPVDEPEEPVDEPEEPVVVDDDDDDDVPVAVIEDEEIPLAPAEEIEEVILTTVEETVEEEVVEILEEEIPLGPITLPKTGEAAPILFYGLGLLLTSLGVTMKRK